MQGGEDGGGQRERKGENSVMTGTVVVRENTKNSFFSSLVCGWLIRQIRGQSHQCALH